MQRTFLQETSIMLMKATVVVLTIVVLVISASVLYEETDGISDGFCNIAVLPVEGIILPYHGIGEFDIITTPESVDNFMADAEDDALIEGVLLEINSPGGTPVASERIAERFRDSSLPVIGLIGDQAASGGYMIASAADYLIASGMSDIGSIGVTMSYLEESKKNEDEGVTYVQLTSGKFKDTGSPNRPLTDEERTLLEADLRVVHDEFVDLVARYRGLDRGVVAELADGSTMPGGRAVDAGLIDSIGNRSTAREIFAQTLNYEPQDIVFCEYESDLFLPF